jgi:hypothetical protein
MPLTNTDAPLWYNVGVFGEAGYAVPNWGNDPGALNPTVIEYVDLAGRNLFAMMHSEDADLRVPPSINTCKKVHRLYIRAVRLLMGRAVPYGEDNLEVAHQRPAGEIYRVYPIPFFKVRSPYMRRWAALVLTSICDAMQHTEGRKEVEISPAFASQILQWLHRAYTNMAIELFNVDRATALAAGFELSDADFAAYDPSKFFTPTELVDTVPRLDRVFTEDRLELLAEGIPVTELPAMGPWPANLSELYSTLRSDATVRPSGASGAAGATSGSDALPGIPGVTK